MSEQRRNEIQSEFDKLVQSLLDGEGIPMDSWTTSLQDVSALTHAVVEDFFRQTNDKRHVTEGYAFSKTKKFETSGKPMRLNLLPGHDMFLLEGHTRPAMKQSKGISKGKGIYSCSLLLSKETGKIIAAKDKSCAAGKRGYCKHIAALAYKLVEAKMSGATELPKPISCTDVRQQWGLPTIKAQQDPEKELMKRNPLHEIVFEKHILTRDNLGGRKRKLPSEINCNYNSRPKGEPAIDQTRVDILREELSKSNYQRFVCKFLSYRPEESCSAGPPKESSDKENTPTPIVSPPQRSECWFRERIGKVTSSKAPALIGLQGRKEFIETWDCIVNNKEEPPKNFRNFQRGIKFESSAVDCFRSDSGAEVKECGMFPLESDRRFGASPDRTFQGETCRELVDVNTGIRIALSGLCLLEVKTRADGCTEPLNAVAGAHVCQVQLQQECANSNVCILQSFVPESKKSRYFLIWKHISFVNCFLQVCSAILDNKSLTNICHDNHNDKLKMLEGQVPDFENLLALRQWATAFAKSCCEVKFVS